MSEINYSALDKLPDLPQIPDLRQITAALWQRPEVVAVWLGGSFARGAADEFSDLDLRVAVTPNALGAWREPNLDEMIGGAVVGERLLSWDDTVLHHALLASGIILDLLVESTDGKLPDDFTVVLACRDTAFQERLSSVTPPEPPQLKPADPEAVRKSIVNYWIDSHKHAKVLGRGLDMLVLVGLTAEQTLLTRLWHMEATGLDQTASGGTIHTLTAMVQPLMDSPQAARQLAILGNPRRTRGEIIRTIEANRNEVARAGRQLAATLGFAYPEALERTVRQT